MNIQYFEDKEQLAVNAANIVVGEIRKKPNLLLCAATGNTPRTTYQNIVKLLKTEEASNLKVLKLDEWGGIPMSQEGTCEHYLQQHLVKPLHISKVRSQWPYRF